MKTQSMNTSRGTQNPKIPEGLDKDCDVAHMGSTHYSFYYYASRTQTDYEPAWVYVLSCQKPADAIIFVK